MLFSKNSLSRILPAFVSFSILLYSCNSNNSSEQTSEQSAPKLVKSAEFNADSAFQFVQKQVDFGPRVPNTLAHKACKDYLVASLKKYGFQVTEQDFTATTFDNKSLNATNIIGSFNPSAAKRILLTSHWDSRPFSDQDSIVKDKPVIAANDGASGVGILLEVARTISAQSAKPDIGVDIIFFDAEDWGSSGEDTTLEYSGYCLGSKHWAENKHVPNYTAYFGVLLDMAGAKGATFFKEGYSVQLADDVVRTVWTTASKLGYSNYFIDERGGSITDDHLPVNQKAHIPMIDIIHTRPNNLSKTFFDQWHTSHDTMDNIDPKTLKAVGQTLVQVLYQEAAGEAL
ncbi:M28 family peptidase [Dyadobacter luticola]|uniref:M28 family peptidase n=1 Tax=Dyadobacter luticola TaxID=1979387 RepID=A0A5R9KUY4_9BACT|nr:M28 family peptidase [Dyadobacter luticola]TLV00044.1 M28 family peptidase [Dyadobacter luticola]